MRTCEVDGVKYEAKSTEVSPLCTGCEGDEEMCDKLGSCFNPLVIWIKADKQ